MKSECRVLYRERTNLAATLHQNHCTMKEGNYIRSLQFVSACPGRCQEYHAKGSASAVACRVDDWELLLDRSRDAVNLRLTIPRPNSLERLDIVITPLGNRIFGGEFFFSSSTSLNLFCCMLPIRTFLTTELSIHVRLDACLPCVETTSACALCVSLLSREGLFYQ